MRPRVIYAPAALEDLNEIWLVLARAADVETADEFARQLSSACEKILLSPLGFRSRTDLGNGLRSYPYKNYMIFYYPKAGGIAVARVLHAARDIDNIIDE